MGHNNTRISYLLIALNKEFWLEVIYCVTQLVHLVYVFGHTYSLKGFS